MPGPAGMPAFLSSLDGALRPGNGRAPRFVPCHSASLRCVLPAGTYRGWGGQDPHPADHGRRRTLCSPSKNLLLSQLLLLWHSPAVGYRATGGCINRLPPLPPSPSLCCPSLPAPAGLPQLALRCPMLSASQQAAFPPLPLQRSRQ